MDWVHELLYSYALRRFFNFLFFFINIFRDYRKILITTQLYICLMVFYFTYTSLQLFNFLLEIYLFCNLISIMPIGQVSVFTPFMLLSFSLFIC